MRADPVHLLQVCRADQEGVLLVLQQCPFLAQLLDQQGEVVSSPPSASVCFFEVLGLAMMLLAAR